MGCGMPCSGVGGAGTGDGKFAGIQAENSLDPAEHQCLRSRPARRTPRRQSRRGEICVAAAGGRWGKVCGEG